MGKVQVDDRDAARIQYRGDWRPIGNTTRTLRSVTEWGSTATFRFNGSYVGVFGSIPAGDGEDIRVDFQVDDNPVVTTVRVTDPDSSDDDVWFGAGPLDSKEHTLVIRYLGNDREFLFDYIEYEDTIVNVSSSSSSSSLLPGPSSDPSRSSEGSSNSISPGTLAGAVVGAVVATAAILLLLFFFYKQRRRQGRKQEVDTLPRSTGGESHIAPFNAGTAMEHANASYPQIKSPMAFTGASMLSSSVQSRHTDEGNGVPSTYGASILQPHRFTLSALSASATISPPAYGSSEGSPVEHRKH